MIIDDSELQEIEHLLSLDDAISRRICALEEAVEGLQLKVAELSAAEPKHVIKIKAATKKALDTMRRNGRVTNNPMYGWDRDGDKWVVNKREQDAITLILGLHKKGYSLRRIAGELHRLGIATKTGKQWASKTVSDVITKAPKYRKLYKDDLERAYGTW